MTNLAYACLWFLTFAIPWESSVIIPGVGTIGRLVGLVTAPIGVVAIVSRGRARPLALFHIISACFVIWVGLTVVWSLDRDRTITTFYSAAQSATLPWLIWELAGTSTRRRGLLQAYVFGAFVSVIYTLINYHSGVASTRSAGDRFAAEGFNPNDLGFLLVLALPMAWHLGLTHRNAILRWINRLYIPAGIVAILLTGSRSSLIGAALALLIVPLTLGRLSLGMKAGVVAIIVATVFAAMIYVPPATWARLATTTTELESGTLNERRVIWEAGLQLFPRYPIGGVGAGAFLRAVIPFLGERKSAHNSYLEVLIEEGAVGFTLFLLLFISIYFHARSAPPEERRFVLILLLTFAVGLLPRAWEFDKATWLMFGLMLAPSAPVAAMVPVMRRWMPARTRVEPQSQAVGRVPPRRTGLPG